MGRWVHRLSSVDPEERLGICAHCGPVRLLKNRSGWRCAIAANTPKEAKYRRTKSGLPRHRRDALLEGASCEICGSDEELVVDHDHESGEVRGVLCRGCNFALGFMKDSWQNMISAADYLRKHE